MLGPTQSIVRDLSMTIPTLLHALFGHANCRSKKDKTNATH